MDLLKKVLGKQDFPCSGCGACCRRVGMALKHSKEFKDQFPYGSKKDGSCEKLNKEGQCSVYNSRPDICRVDVTYKKKWSKIMSRKEAYNLEAKVCNSFIKEDGLDEKFLIKIKE